MSSPLTKFVTMNVTEEFVRRLDKVAAAHRKTRSRIAAELLADVLSVPMPSAVRRRTTGWADHRKAK